MKKVISYITFFVLIPAVTVGGALIFRDRQYAWITLCVALLSCIPFFLHFEHRADVKRLVTVAVMTALSVLGRIIFTPIPAFKPVAAFVIITAMYFGGEAGFLVGSLSAVISNFWFGQGPWTPFQMFSWGLIGLVAGFLSEPMKKSRIVLIIYSILSGVSYSLMTDIWTVLWADGYFNISRYLAALVSALPFTAVYALSNVVFLLIFARPIGKILERIKTKYAL